MPTLDVNATGAASIQFNGGNLPADAITANGIFGFLFDGTSWQLLNPEVHTHNATDIVDGRLDLARLPTSSTANRVLAIGATADENLSFMLVSNAMIANNAIRTAHIQDLNVTNDKIANSTIRQAKMHFIDGFAELGLANNANLALVINAIRALPLTRPVSIRFDISIASVARALRAPLTNVPSVMQIERVRGSSNMLKLTYYTGINTANDMQVFVANHRNVEASIESVDAIVWREIPQLYSGRLLTANLPTSDTANRVLAVGAANSSPSFVLVSNAMIADNAIRTAHIQDLNVTTRTIANLGVTTDKIANLSVTTGKIADLNVTTNKIAELAVNNSRIANSTIRQEKLHAMDGFTELGLPTTATLVDVIAAIRALPVSRLVSVRFNITTPDIAQALRAPLTVTNSMMQIERTPHASNMLLLTYYTGLNSSQTLNTFRIFTANFRDVLPTIENADAIRWREIPLLNSGKLALGQLPTSNTANRVLRIAAADGNPAWAQVNVGTDVTGWLQIAHGGTGANTSAAARVNLGTNDATNLTTGTIPADRIGESAINDVRLADNAVTTIKVANNAITAAKIANVSSLDRNIVIGEGARVGEGFNATGSNNTIVGHNARVGSNGNNNVAVGYNAFASLGSDNVAIGAMASAYSSSASIGNVAIGAGIRVNHRNAAIISPNSSTSQINSNANDRVIIGRASTTVGGWSAWYNLSDSRDKRDISPLGYDPLAFVSALKPKQYRTDYRSAYRCFKEIGEAEYEALCEYDKMHRVYEVDVYSIEGTGIEWIEDPCILTNNGRIKGLEDVPDFLGKVASTDRFGTQYLSNYAKSKDVAKQAFHDQDGLKLPAIEEAWGRFCEEHGAEAEADLFVESRVKQACKARFLIVELEPDGTYAGQRYHWGFMAQEVEQAAKGMGIDCPAVQHLAYNKDSDGVPEGDDLYTMGYTELIAPLVGAVQQLTGMVRQLQAEVDSLKNERTA